MATVLFALVGLAGALAVVVVPAAVRAATAVRPVPLVALYPGQVIAAEHIVERRLRTAAERGAAVATRAAEVIGKVPRRTLLPGRAIPLAWLGQPDAVRPGAVVRAVYQRGGLAISAAAQVLQAGAVGDLVQARNLESGVVISGLVQADGSLRVTAW